MKKRENKAGARWYMIEDREYPSVTTILNVIGKPALIAWSANTEREMVTNASVELYQSLDPKKPKLDRTSYLMSLKSMIGTVRAGQKQLAQASEIGKQAHSLIEWSLRASLMQDAGQPPKVDQRVDWAFMAYQDWAKSVNLKPIWIEQTVWSSQYGYAGTMDLLAEVGGKLTVVDWKTGKSIYPEAMLQNAAYRHALREMGHGDPVQGIIVRLPKDTNDPEFEAQVVPDSEDSLFQVFLHTFELWKWAQKGEEAYLKKNARRPMLLKDLQETKARHFRDPRSYVRNDASEVLYGPDWTQRKREVWERGSGRCEYWVVLAERCRSEMQDPHHIVPRSKGRDDRMGNLIGLCRLHHDLFDRRKLQWTPKLKES